MTDHNYNEALILKMERIIYSYIEVVRWHSQRPLFLNLKVGFEAMVYLSVCKK